VCERERNENEKHLDVLLCKKKKKKLCVKCDFGGVFVIFTQLLFIIAVPCILMKMAIWLMSFMRRLW